MTTAVRRHAECCPGRPWWNHRGIGLAVGGLLERVVAMLLPFVLLAQAYLVVRDLGT